LCANCSSSLGIGKAGKNFLLKHRRIARRTRQTPVDAVPALAEVDAAATTGDRVTAARIDADARALHGRSWIKSPLHVPQPPSFLCVQSLMEQAIPATTERVERNSPEVANRRIQDATNASVARRALQGPEAIARRLEELEHEWDIERTLETNAASIALGGVVLGALVDRRFLILPAAVCAFLLQHAVQGWCPPVPFFRKRGVRTADEIAEERYALKVLRGDFDGVTGDGRRDPARVLAAVRR